MERLRQLIHEIHRRSLWQVLGIYVVASWAVISGVGTLGDALGLHAQHPPRERQLCLAMPCGSSRDQPLRGRRGHFANVLATLPAA